MIGAILIVIIEAFIIYRCLRAAQKARDLAGAMIAYGVAMLLFFQSATNIAVNLRLIPVSGLPLPFISYGGSGLMALDDRDRAGGERRHAPQGIGLLMRGRAD